MTKAKILEDLNITRPRRARHGLLAKFYQIGALAKAKARDREMQIGYLKAEIFRLRRVLVSIAGRPSAVRRLQRQLRNRDEIIRGLRADGAQLRARILSKNTWIDQMIEVQRQQSDSLDKAQTDNARLQREMTTSQTLWDAVDRVAELESEVEERNAAMDGWKPVEAWSDGNEVVILGIPMDSHNCDQMGCGSVGPHVINRCPLHAREKVAGRG